MRIACAAALIGLLGISSGNVSAQPPRAEASTPAIVRVGSQEEAARIRARLVVLLEGGQFGALLGGGPQLGTRLLQLGPLLPSSGSALEAAPRLWNALLYDYSAESAYNLTLGDDGALRSFRTLPDQPVPTRSEISAAIDLLRKHPVYGGLLKVGKLVPYPAMPPVDYTPGVPRTLHIGLLPHGTEATHEIVGVRLGSGAVISYGSARHAPQGAIATRMTCGLPRSDDCPANDVADSGTFRVQWPAASNPIWDFIVVRPAATASELSNGAGVELREVRFRGSLVLLTAHVPVLNVHYEGDTCGPFRDWLKEESCMAVAGTQEVQPGFYVTSQPAGTICNTGTDSGTGRGVILQNASESLTIISQMEAGWYRYLNGWKLGIDGTIQAIFQYAGTENSCMCDKRVHHAYWRFDWALGGEADSTVAGGWRTSTQVQRRAGATDPWLPISTEQTFLRAPTSPHLRVIDNPDLARATVAYEIIPGANDRSAMGDAFAKSDVWILKWNAQEIADTQSYPPEIKLEQYLNGEDTNSGRVVVWYGAHIPQGGSGPGVGDVCATVGPTLRRVRLAH
jgi:hypothetical protein